jgi:signal recognition particle subunit SRP14
VLLRRSKLDTYSTKKIRAEEEATEKASGDTVMAADSKDKEYPTMVRLASGTKTKASTLVRITEDRLPVL